jgi:hypothetical protein
MYISSGFPLLCVWQLGICVGQCRVTECAAGQRLAGGRMPTVLLVLYDRDG